MNNDLRITKLKEYLFEVVKTVNSSIKAINVNALSKDINNYSLDKVPTDSTVEKWITGQELHKDIYSFRSRAKYSYNTLDNLNSIGFFEKFEALIRTNNKKGILPEIENIQSIECLNCGTMQSANESTAEFDIQLQITYITN